MRAEVIRIYKSVHTWTGIVAGFMLFIAFYAGALTMFEVPLNRWAAQEQRAAMAPFEQSEKLIADTLAARPDARKSFTLHLHDEEHIPGRITWSKGRGDKSPWSADYAADGSLHVERNTPSGMAQLIDHVHRTGGLPGDGEVTELIMGVVSTLYVVALVSGLIILLPSLSKDFFALRVGKNLKRMWLDAHNAIGITSLPFHIVIAVTAVVFAFHDQIYDIQDTVVYGEKVKAQMATANAKPKPDRKPAAMLPPDALLAKVRELSPEFQPAAMQYTAPATASATVRISGEDPRYVLRRDGSITLNAITGEVLNQSTFPGNYNTWAAPVAGAFALHFGTFGGTPIRWTYFLMGLGGAFLFYSGNLLWIETRRKNARKGGAVEQSRSTRWLSAATVGVCLGCITALSLTIAAARLLPAQGAQLNSWHETVYYGGFFLCVLWAFLRGAPRAGVELLWASAASTLLIAAATVWRGFAIGAVDIGAVVMACGFAWMALAAMRRQRLGASDSVWSRKRAAATPA
ncbi:PepSY domain-containing protein [Massilia sp. MB5]|uniref:PepSY-associated TM helix domain-containing protein n=1 Tax=Massilia sp. MB5 TaxID=2919578 RepID=UPI001F1002DF|nr:PepSY-associated TM helix domain-containing protein [Massilia sp. MB5]UMR32769.1 PepSY domain-containing protein [Massilia sp. MB5]